MKLFILIFLSLPLYLYAQSYRISNIPLPKTYIQNLDPYPCDEKCLKEYVDNGFIFSFLSFADLKIEDRALNDVKMINISVLNLGLDSYNNDLKIAMLLPSNKIGRYASSTTNAVFAYLISRNHSFELKSYEINSESIDDIKVALDKMQEDGFYHIIAPLTRDGAKVVNSLNPDVDIYFPTINKKDINTTNPYLHFGAIDYEQQSEKLLEHSVSPLVIMHDKSSLGYKLTKLQEKIFKEINLDNEKSSVVKFSIRRRTTNLKYILKDDKKIQEGSFLINTPVVKTGMIMSQLTLYDVNETNILSTQINYDPLLFSMTQYSDRKKMIIANSITEHHNVLVGANSLLNNDIVYDWINYSSTIGIDYFFHQITGEPREYNIDIIDNQVAYKIELLRPAYSRFIKY